MDKNEQREIALEEISKAIYETIQKGVGFDVVFLALHGMEKSAAWKLKYQFGFDDDTIKGIRKTRRCSYRYRMDVYICAISSEIHR